MFSDAITVSPAYPIKINYHLNYKEMIKAVDLAHASGHVNPKRFPITGEGIVELVIRLVRFHRNINRQNALQKLTALGRVPIDIAGLLALGASFPELQLETTIIALGSTSNDREGQCGVPCLTYMGHYYKKRVLTTENLKAEWDERYSFATVFLDQGGADETKSVLRKDAAKAGKLAGGFAS
jgi:hypothetical protein